MTNPGQLIVQFLRRYPDMLAAWGMVIDARIARESDPDRWPGNVFVPSETFFYHTPPSRTQLAALVQHDKYLIPEKDNDGYRKCMMGWMLGTWRMTQSIYRFDPDVYPALLNSPIPDALPAETFLRLPHWCVYIETPDLPDILYEGIAPAKIEGVWVLLDYYGQFKKEMCLGIFAHCPSLSLTDYVGTPLVLLPLREGWDIQEALDFAYGTLGTFDGILARKAALAARPLVSSILSLLLWLCSEEPDISNVRGEPVSPENPVSRKVRKITRIYPAAGPTVLTVAARLGGEIRQSRDQVDYESGKTIRKAHIRKAHWHGFWSGPRTGERKFSVKWLPPVLVSGV